MQRSRIIVFNLFIVLVCLIADLGMADQSSTVLYQKDSIYQVLKVEQYGSVRHLYGGRMSFSALDLDEPYRHVLEYTEMMILGMAYVDHPQTILMIGLGAGTVVSYLRKYYPDLRMTLVELDPDVVTCAQKFFRFQVDSGMRVATQDGRWYLMRDTTAYDLIFLDAYHGDYIPFHLLTKEFLQLVKQHLTPNGIVVANTWTHQALADRESATYANVFGHFDSYEGIRSGNRVIIAANNPNILEESALFQRMVDTQAAIQFQEVNLPRLFKKTYDPDVLWPKETRLLTDDYAPVNTLMGW
jgi:spermidine synthase